jgi:polyphenol oxidase
MTGLGRDECIVPAWPAPSNVKALVTTRAGGVSSGAFASLNLGFSTADAQSAVESNRARLAALLPAEPRWLSQVHGARVVRADAISGRVEADAAVTREPHTVCAVLVADCLPVLLTDYAGSVVGAAHAGWRGLAAGVLENTVDEMTRGGTAPGELLAFLGPAIGRHAFEVGDDVYSAFTRKDGESAAAFERGREGKWHADLFALARRALARCGVIDVHGGGLCTYSDAQRFYSYRRDKITGRMAAVIWRDPL